MTNAKLLTSCKNSKRWTAKVGFLPFAGKTNVMLKIAPLGFWATQHANYERLILHCLSLVRQAAYTCTRYEMNFSKR